MSGKNNLIPMKDRTPEEQREIARKGGIASGKARRKKRTMREAAQLILNLPATEEQSRILEQYGIPKKDHTALTIMMAKAVQMASDGDLRAAEFVRDTIGESPKYQLYEQRLQVLLADREAANAIVSDWLDAVIASEESSNPPI